MGWFTVGQNLRVRGGSVQMGADVNLYRNAANILKTDDALTVVGALTPTGGVASPGTPFYLPTGTASPTLGTATDGQVYGYTKSNKAYLAIVLGGSTMVLQFPAATNGTATFTIGGTP